MGSEKRQYPRLSVPLEAQYRIADSKKWQSGSLHDLSAGGLGLVADGAPDEIEALERVRFRLSPGDHEFELAGETVHFRQDGGKTVAGIRFTEPDSETIYAIHHYVFEQLIEQSAELLPPDAETTDRVDCGEPIQIRYDQFTRFVDEVTENLSPTGMFIRSQNPHPPGSTFEFRFQLNEDFALIQGKAEVIWIREVGNDKDLPCGMGVRFLELTDESHELIARVARQKPGDPNTASDLSTVDPHAREPNAAETEPQSRRGTSQLMKQLDRLRAKARKREQEYRVQVERAASVLATLRSRVAELEQQSLDYQSEIERERSSHQEQIESVASNRDQLVHEFEQLQNERDQLATDLAAEKSAAEELDREHRQAVRDLEKLEIDLTEEKKRAGALEEEIQGVREHLGEAEKTAAGGDATDEIEPLRAKLSELETSLSTSETARKQIGIANKEAHKKERAARNALRQAEEQRDKLRKELAQARADSHSGGANGGGPAAASAGVVGETEAHEKIASLEREQDLLSKRIRVAEENEEAAEVKLRKLGEEHDQVLAEIDSLRQAAEDADARLQQTTEETERLRAEHEARIGEIRAEYENDGGVVSEDADADELRRSLQIARRQLEEARAEADERIRDADAEAEELRGSLSASEAARRQIGKQAAEASAQEESIREEMQQLKLRQRAVGSEAARTESSLRDVGARLSARDIELESLLSERDALEAELSEQRAQFEVAHRRSRKWPLRAAALVAAGTFAGILTGSVLLGGGDRSGSLPNPVDASNETPAAVTAAASEVATSKTGAEPPVATPVAAEAPIQSKVTTETAPQPSQPTTTAKPAPRRPPIAKAVESWASAWAGQEVDRYLEAYDADFDPPKDLTRDAWVAQRQTRIERPEWIRVEVDQIETTDISADRARAVFVQTYETPTYRDQVTKTLELVFRDGRWKILQETSSN